MAARGDAERLLVEQLHHAVSLRKIHTRESLPSRSTESLMEPFAGYAGRQPQIGRIEIFGALQALCAIVIEDVRWFIGFLLGRIVDSGAQAGRWPDQFSRNKHMFLVGELSDLATVFDGEEGYEWVYESVCGAMRELLESSSRFSE